MKILSLEESIHQSSNSMILKSSAKASIRTESNSYEYGGQTSDAPVLYLRAFRWGASSWLASAQTILVENRPAERDDSRAVSHTCHGCEIAIGIVALDTSIATGLFFIALPPKGKRYFAVSSSSAAISNNAYLLSRTLFELLLSNKCFSSIFEITGWFVSCDDFKRVYHLPLSIMKRKNNFIRNKYVNFELIF